MIRMAASDGETAWQPSKLFATACSSSEAVAHAVNFIVDRAAGVLFEKYLAERSNDYAVQSIWHDMLSSVKVMALQHDAGEAPRDDASMPAASGFSNNPYAVQGPSRAGEAGLWSCEDEPDPGLIDSWARAAVPTLSSAPESRVRVPISATKQPAAQASGRTRRLSDKMAESTPKTAVLAPAVLSPASDRPYSPGLEGALLQSQLDIPERPSSSLGNVIGTTAQSSMEATRKAALESMRRKEAAEAAKAAAQAKQQAEAADAAKRLKKQLKGQKFTTDESGQVIVIQSVSASSRAAAGPAPVHVAVRDNATGETTVLGGLPTAGQPQGQAPQGLGPHPSETSQLSGRSGVLPPTASAAAWEELFSHPSPSKAAPPPPRAYATLQSPPGAAAHAESFFKEKPSVSALLVDESVELAPGVEAREGRRKSTAKAAPKSDKHMSRADFNAMATQVAASTHGVSTAERLRSRGGSAQGGRRASGQSLQATAAASQASSAQGRAFASSAPHMDASSAAVEGKASLDSVPPSTVGGGGGGSSVSSLLQDSSTSVRQPRSARQGRRAPSSTAQSASQLQDASSSNSSARQLPQPAQRPNSTADPVSRAAVVGQGRRLPRDRSPVRTATLQRTIERELQEAALAQGADAARIRAMAAHRISDLESQAKASSVAQLRRPGDAPPLTLTPADASGKLPRRAGKLRSGVPIVSNEQLERRPHSKAPLGGTVSRLAGSASNSALAAVGASSRRGGGGGAKVYGEEHRRKSNTGRLQSTPNAQVALGL